MGMYVCVCVGVCVCVCVCVSSSLEVFYIVYVCCDELRQIVLVCTNVIPQYVLDLCTHTHTHTHEHTN